MQGYPPVIIIGMHRSGTSMITKTLKRLGLFIGYKRDPNEEAWLFLKLNQWILSLCDATWDDPSPINELLACDDAVSKAVEYLRFHLHTPRILRYLGLRRYLQYRDMFKLNFHWGWKDPQNTFTLPLWMNVFGQVRVIHIYRNGVDVANSLMKRSQKAHHRSIKTFARWRDWDGRAAYGLLPILPPFKLHRMSLEAGFKLWETYTERAEAHMQALPKEYSLHLSYEDFIENPLDWTHTICDFLELPVSPKNIELSIQHIQPERRLVFKNNPALTEFYDTVKSTPLMVRLGYHDIDG